MIDKTLELVKAQITDALFDKLLKGLGNRVSNSCSFKVYNSMYVHLLSELRDYSYRENQCRHLDKRYNTKNE
jgi:hypothetical protein